MILSRLFKVLATWRKNKSFLSIGPDAAANAKLVLSRLPDKGGQTGSTIIDDLLRCAETQWQQGDWISIASRDKLAICNHPERAKLALLTAAGHMQLGDMSMSRSYVNLALRWGCEKRLVCQIIIAGVHHQLGIALLRDRKEVEALHHFRASLANVPFHGDRELSLNARMANLEFDLMSHDVGVQPDKREYRSQVPSSNNHFVRTVEKQFFELKEKIEEQNRHISHLEKNVHITIKKEAANNAQQIEAYMRIQNHFNHGQHLPKMHGWPISPDFALFFIEKLSSNFYDAVVEFGSGTSTVLIAKTICVRRDQWAKNGRQTKQISFEHLKEYYNATRNELIGAGFNDVDLVLAPLDPQIIQGVTYPYYGCSETLVELGKNLTSSEPKVFILVDGPPGKTGKHARYPALPLLLKHMPTIQIDILLDDYAREDEQQVVELWIRDLDQNPDYEYTITTIKMEKDACFISIKPKFINQPAPAEEQTI